MNKYILILFSIFISVLISCSIVPPTKKSGNKLFLPGLYKHKVFLELKNKKKLNFLGFNQVQKDKVKIIALSPFGTTVLSYIRSIDHEKLYYDKNLIPLSEFEVRSMIFMIEKMYSLEDDICIDTKCSYSMFGESILIMRDLEKQVKTIHYKKKNKFKIDIEVESYERSK